MSFTVVRLACFRLGMAPLNPMMKGQIARTALPRTGHHIRPEPCPGISGITVPYLLKSLSANYRNGCPRLCETRNSDADVHALALQRPSVITGLSMPTARSDFVDRSIAVELGTIDTRQRLTEATLDAMMQELRPALFGLLLDAVSAALRNEVAVRDRLEGTNLPRMADFAVWAEAAGSAFGWRPNDFLDEYQGMLKQRMADAAEEDPLCAAVADMMHSVEGDPPVLIGKASVLLEHLRSHVEREWRRDTTMSGNPIGRSPAEARWFPINARAMRAQLEQNRRPLEALGVIWSTGPDPHSRTAGEVHTLKLGVKPSRLAGKADKEFARQSLDLTEEADRPWMREEDGL
jgi:hypothetical protein